MPAGLGLRPRTVTAVENYERPAWRFQVLVADGTLEVDKWQLRQVVMRLSPSALVDLGRRRGLRGRGWLRLRVKLSQGRAQGIEARGVGKSIVSMARRIAAVTAASSSSVRSIVGTTRIVSADILPSKAASCRAGGPRASAVCRPFPLPRGAGAGTGGKDVADCGNSHTRSATTHCRYAARFPPVPAFQGQTSALSRLSIGAKKRPPEGGLFNCSR
jgi:hypothetical protein